MIAPVYHWPARSSSPPAAHARAEWWQHYLFLSQRLFGPEFLSLVDERHSLFDFLEPALLFGHEDCDPVAELALPPERVVEVAAGEVVRDVPDSQHFFQYYNTQ